MLNAARPARTCASPTTPAATGTVRSAKPLLPKSGWSTARPTSCPCPISTSSSRCRGLSPDGLHWIACRPRFFLPVPVLSALFRRLFLERLTTVYQAGRLQFFADQAALAEPAVFKARLAAVQKAKWVVYAKPPFGGPGAVLAYLSRYTHRIAIANSRLVAFDGQR